MATAEGSASGSASAALFGKFITDVADQFKRDDAVKVAVCLNLTSAKRDEIKWARKPGLALLNHLQAHDIIKEDNIKGLCDALEHCRLNRTSRIANEEFEKYKSKKKRDLDQEPPRSDGTDTGSTPYNPETLRIILHDNLKRDDCYELAVYFSLPDHVVDSVKESSTYANKLVESLENRTIIRKGNISPLLIALKDRGLNRVANEIQTACEKHHFATCEEEGPATDEEGSGDSAKCKFCPTGTLVEFKYENKLLAVQCQNKDCLAKWEVPPTFSSKEKFEIKHGNQTLTYKPPEPLNLSKIEYEEVKDCKLLKRGDHIIFRRFRMYDHHAILVSVKDSSKLEVIHWTSGWPSLRGWISRKSDSVVSIKKEEIPFPPGGLKRVNYDKEDRGELVLAKAFRMLETNKVSYSLIDNNCESLAAYCKTGKVHSVQGELLKKYRPFVQKIMSLS